MGYEWAIKEMMRGVERYRNVKLPKAQVVQSFGAYCKDIINMVVKSGKLTEKQVANLWELRFNLANKLYRKKLF